jgi:hypothetical protein
MSLGVRLAFESNALKFALQRKSFTEDRFILTPLFNYDDDRNSFIPEIRKNLLVSAKKESIF